MKYLILVLLGSLLLWVVYLMVANRRRSPHESRNSDSGSSSGDSGNYSSSHCDSSDSSCSDGGSGGD